MNSDGDSKFFYFGYGYNLNPTLFRERLKDGKWLSDGKHKTGTVDGTEPEDLGNALLHNHRFSYNLDLQKFNEKGTVANVSVASNHLVYGALYQVNEIQLRRLDRSEEVPRIYTRKLIKVHKENDPHSFVEAWIDHGVDTAITTMPHPEPDYVNEIVRAAVERHFPIPYINDYLRFPPQDK